MKDVYQSVDDKAGEGGKSLCTMTIWGSGCQKVSKMDIVRLENDTCKNCF